MYEGCKPKHTTYFEVYFMPLPALQVVWEMRRINRICEVRHAKLQGTNSSKSHIGLQQNHEQDNHGWDRCV